MLINVNIYEDSLANYGATAKSRWEMEPELRQQKHDWEERNAKEVEATELDKCVCGGGRRYQSITHHKGWQQESDALMGQAGWREDEELSAAYAVYRVALWQAHEQRETEVFLWGSPQQGGSFV